ncbi:TPA: DUF1353 domain-containing protein [Escherichia coli]|nr:DUF1353 domain-containing protein [Escherichia coli]HBA6893519.1 DUF1353 domain-containing protein [Escherichia coli]HBA7228891.1 DUF1353 domain-containing protein [Escherichia coli]
MRILWSVFPPHGRYARAAIIHDWLYDNALRTKREADKIFLDAMCVLGGPRWRRMLMHCAVRLFGRGSYRPARHNAGQSRKIKKRTVMMCGNSKGRITNSGYHILATSLSMCFIGFSIR